MLRLLPWPVILLFGLAFLGIGIRFLRLDPTRAPHGSDIPGSRETLRVLGVLLIISTLLLTPLGIFISRFYATGPERVPELGMVGKWTAEDMESVQVHFRGDWYALTSQKDRAAVATVLNSLERHNPGEYKSDGSADIRISDVTGERYHYDFSLIKGGEVNVMLPRSGFIMAQMTSPKVREFLDSLLDREFVESEDGALVPAD